MHLARIHTLFLASMVGGFCAIAEEAKPAPRFARVLALGEPPPFRQEIRDGVRYELPAPPGSIPPSDLLTTTGKSNIAKTTIRLGRVSNRIEVPGDKGVFNLLPGEQDSRPWLKTNRPESGDFLILLWRSPKAKNWAEPRSLIVPDGSLAPRGTVRITNIFPQSVRIAWADERLLLIPGKSIRRTVTPGSPVSMQVFVPRESGTMKRYYSSSVNLNPNERGFITVYRADSKNPRRPLKVHVFREPVLERKPKVDAQRPD